MFIDQFCYTCRNSLALVASAFLHFQQPTSGSFKCISESLILVASDIELVASGNDIFSIFDGDLFARIKKFFCDLEPLLAVLRSFSNTSDDIRSCGKTRERENRGVVLVKLGAFRDTSTDSHAYLTDIQNSVALTRSKY